MDDTRREAALALLARHPMPAGQRRAWLTLTGLAGAPVDARQALPRAAGALAAALLGLGLILWVAANWATLGRAGQFALLQAAVAVPAAAAIALPRARGPLLLVALLAQGGLLAYFGQTYQTGADPWQLFALWTLLALPLALAARSELLWTPWALVAVTGVTLWVGTHTGWLWREQSASLAVTLLGWAGCAALAALLGHPLLRQRLGSGSWSQRLAVVGGLVLLLTSGLSGLFADEVAPVYGLGLAVALLAAAALWLAREPDLFSLSAVMLTLDTLLLAGLTRAIAEQHPRDWILPLLLLGLVAAGLVALSASVVLRAGRREAPPPALGSAA